MILSEPEARGPEERDHERKKKAVALRRRPFRWSCAGRSVVRGVLLLQRRDRLVLAVGAGRQDGAVALGGDRLEAVHDSAGARRDQAADDDVLLEALQGVDAAGNGRLGQYARGLLERGRRDERL